MHTLRTSLFITALTFTALSTTFCMPGGDGDGDGNGDGDGDGDGDSDLEDQLLDAYVTFWMSCLGPFSGDLLVLSEGEAGAASIRAEYEVLLRELIGSWLVVDGVTINSETAPGCIAVLSSGDCTAFADYTSVCDDVFIGTIDDGDACVGSNVCESQLCEKSYNDTCGVCVADVPAPAGATCHVRDCVETAYCDYDYDDATDTSINVCVAFAGAGDVCIVENGDDTTWLTCADGLDCNYSLKVCVAPVAAGADCVEPVPGEDYTTTLPCVEGYACDYGAEICIALVGVGEPCGYDPDTGASPSCDDELYCASSTSLCAPLPGAGESCEDAYDCASGAYCNYDTFFCNAYPGEGGDCSETYECAGDLECDWGTYICIVSHPLGTEVGDPCTRNDLGCESPLECVGEAGAQTCVNVLVVDEGEACDGETRICGYVLMTGLFCDATTATCQKVAIADAGEPCDDEQTFCRNGFSTHYCSPTTETCVPNKAPGEACEGYGECGYLTGTCSFDDAGNGETGTCKVYKLLGESCTDADSICYFGAECREGVCAATVETCE